ncbi:MAG: hypothetical protein AAFV53_17120 [Myxococcota bacterium]
MSQDNVYAPPDARSQQSSSFSVVDTLMDTVRVFFWKLPFFLSAALVSAIPNAIALSLTDAGASLTEMSSSSDYLSLLLPLAGLSILSDLLVSPIAILIAIAAITEQPAIQTIGRKYLRALLFYGVWMVPTQIGMVLLLPGLLLMLGVPMVIDLPGAIMKSRPLVRSSAAQMFWVGLLTTPALLVWVIYAQVAMFIDLWAENLVSFGSALTQTLSGLFYFSCLTLFVVASHHAAKMTAGPDPS